jgi:hypothetical protein
MKNLSLRNRELNVVAFPTFPRKEIVWIVDSIESTTTLESRYENLCLAIVYAHLNGAPPRRLQELQSQWWGVKEELKMKDSENYVATVAPNPR